MKNKYFYIAVTAVTILLCLPGCTETSMAETESTTSSDSSSNIDNDNINDNNGQSPSETTVTTLTYLQTFERITVLNKETTEDIESAAITKIADKKTDEAKTSQKEADVTDKWFSAHTMFKINTIEEDSRFDGTWYRFPSDENSDTTSSTVVKSNRFNIDISENEDNE